MMQKAKKKLTALWVMLSAATAVLALTYSPWGYAQKYPPLDVHVAHNFEYLFTRVVLKQAGIGVIPDIPMLVKSRVVCGSNFNLRNKKFWDINCIPVAAYSHQLTDNPYIEVKISTQFSVDKAMESVKNILINGSLGEYTIYDPDGSKRDQVTRDFIGNDHELFNKCFVNKDIMCSRGVWLYPDLEYFFNTKDGRKDEVFSAMRKAMRHPKISVDERSGITSLYFPYEQ